MNTSIRFASSCGNWSMSRNVSTWRSGMTSRCVSAFGLMSRTATNPSVSATWSPSRYSLQKRQSSGSEYSLLRDRLRAHAHQLADGSVHEPRRIVVAVAAAGSIDEDDVLGPELAAPAFERRRLGGRTKPSTAFLLHGRGNGIVGFGLGTRARRVRKDVHLGDAGLGDDGQRLVKRDLRLGREADDHVRRQVEVDLQRCHAGQVAAGRVATRHVTE